MIEVVEPLSCRLQGAPAEEPIKAGTEDWKMHVPATAVDPKDADTPDNWIPRDPRIQRLTGRHPLNCESPMDVLMQSGFITPPSLHFVRNHGACPKLDWNTHRIEINGLVEKPMSISMDELIKFPSVTIPVTLVCAGNRRKEENMIKKSIGFNWGPCAVSTSYWTGVRLCDLMNHVGIKTAAEGGNYVSFRGPKSELPKGDDGSYGTSLRRATAMDPACDVLVAYKQNGRWLTPDHGFPVRMIIPGHIGGRMVKWLSEITVTEEESNNFYHYHDNRVLPPHVDEELAKKEGWWYKPDFIINELNINSAVARPWHDEVVSLAANKPYKLQGYAYTGGGRKVIRVEVSLDDGVTWRQCEIRRFEQPTPAYKHWCWVHWDLEITTFDFTQGKELLLRAMDASMNTQPATITWNVMGMMNNCYYRIKIHHCVDAQGNIGVTFQHPAPVQAGENGNIGWREVENLAKQSASVVPTANPVVVAVPKGGPRKITMAEVEQHNTEESAWFVHEGKVYDATPYLDDHPGGAESILISAGMDATDEFNSIHSSKAKAMLAQYYIGDLVADTDSGAPQENGVHIEAVAPLANGTHKENGYANGKAVEANGKVVEKNGKLANGTSVSISVVAGIGAAADLVALDPRKKIAFKLAEKIRVSHNVFIFRFALQSGQHRFGLPVGKHVFLYAPINGETVVRAYTPTSSDDDLGHFDLLVKIYRANTHPKFPEGGKMSQYLDAMEIGGTIDVKGPLGHVVYEDKGRLSINRKPVHVKRLSMIAGGTGITPCYQIVKRVLKDPLDTTELSLVYANTSVDDILLREELDNLAAKHSNFRVWYTVDKAPEDWKFSRGYINEEMLRTQLFPADEETLCLMCGPPPMLKFACVPNLEKMGYSSSSMIEF